MSIENFGIFIECKQLLSKKNIDNSPFFYDPDLDSLEGLFYQLTELFYESDIVFSLKIMGVEYMNFQIEFCMFLEEFNKLLAFATKDEIPACDVEFYEQGSSAVLSFSKLDNESYNLIFDDKEVFDFQLIKTKGSIINLQLSLYTFYYRFLFLTDKLFPFIAKSEPYKNWRCEVEVLFGYTPEKI